MAQKNARHASTVLLAATLQSSNSFGFVLSDGFDLEFGLELDRPIRSRLLNAVGAGSQLFDENSHVEKLRFMHRKAAPIKSVGYAVQKSSA